MSSKKRVRLIVFWHHYFSKDGCGKYVVGSVVDSTVMILVHNNYDRALEEFFGFKLCA